MLRLPPTKTSVASHPGSLPPLDSSSHLGSVHYAVSPPRKCLLISCIASCQCSTQRSKGQYNWWRGTKPQNVLGHSWIWSLSAWRYSNTFQSTRWMKYVIGASPKTSHWQRLSFFRDTRQTHGTHLLSPDHLFFSGVSPDHFVTTNHWSRYCFCYWRQSTASALPVTIIRSSNES